MVKSSQSLKPSIPLRIGFDATWLVADSKSGVSYYLKNLITTLAATYPEAITLTGHYFGSPKHQTDLVQAPNISYKASRFLPLKLNNLLRRWRIEIPFEILARKRFDFLLFPAYSSSPSLFHTPSMVIIYDLAYLDVPQTLSPRNQRDLKRNVPRSIARASFITTISKWSEQRLASHYQTKKPTIITYIPPSLEPAQNPATIVREMGIDEPFILFVGTLEPRKNILGLLAAYELLPITIRNEHGLVLAGGEGWKDDEIKQRIQGLQRAGLNVITPGYVTSEQRTALYQQASVFVLPSFYEGFGMPLLEAMACGLPVITSDIPVFREVCNDAAAYVDPHEPAAISKAIGELLYNQASRQRLIDAGKKNLERFSWDSVAKDIYTELKEILQ